MVGDDGAPRWENWSWSPYFSRSVAFCCCFLRRKNRSANNPSIPTPATDPMAAPALAPVVIPLTELGACAIASARNADSD